MNRLEEAYRQLGDDAPVVGDLDRAIGTVGRRRRAMAAGAPVLAALLVVGALVVNNLWQPRPEVVNRPPAFTIDNWAWPTSSTNTGARVGTLLYQVCVEGNTCPVHLRRADGKEVALRQLRPDLADILERDGGIHVDHLSLSYDAQWLGVGVGQSYHVYRLDDPSQVFTLPAGRGRSYWTVIDWGQSSREVALALHEDGRVIKYAWITLHAGGDIDTYVPSGRVARMLPERLAGAEGGVVVAEPEPEPSNGRATKITTEVLKLTGPDKGRLGSWWSGTPVPDAAAFLEPDETLTFAETGVQVSSCPPLDDGTGGSMCSTLVWTGSGVTGVVKAWTGTEGERYDVPPGEEWGYVGLLPIEAIAVRKNGLPAELVAVSADDRQQQIATLPDNARILLPGMTGLS